MSKDIVISGVKIEVEEIVEAEVLDLDLHVDEHIPEADREQSLYIRSSRFYISPRIMFTNTNNVEVTILFETNDVPITLTPGEKAEISEGVKYNWGSRVSVIITNDTQTALIVFAFTNK